MSKAIKRSFAVIVMAVVAIAMLAPTQLDAAHADSFNPAKYKKRSQSIRTTFRSKYRWDQRSKAPRRLLLHQVNLQ